MSFSFIRVLHGRVIAADCVDLARDGTVASKLAVAILAFIRPLLVLGVVGAVAVVAGFTFCMSRHVSAEALGLRYPDRMHAAHIIRRGRRVTVAVCIISALHGGGSRSEERLPGLDSATSHVLADCRCRRIADWIINTGGLVEGFGGFSQVLARIALAG